MTTAITDLELQFTPGLGALHVDFKIFQWKCPSQNENGLALSKMKFQVCYKVR